MAKSTNTIHTIITNSFVAAMKTSSKAAAPKREVSKADLCRAFFQSNPGLARKDYINEFKKLGMTDHGAATYWYNCRKEAKKQAALATIAALENEVIVAPVNEEVAQEVLVEVAAIDQPVEQEAVEQPAPKKSKKKAKKVTEA